MSRRILVTAAGSGPSNNLMRSLVRADLGLELLGCHSDRFLLTKSPAQRNFLVPALTSVEGGDEAFERALRSLVQKAGIDLVIPGNDRDALAIAAIQERQRLPCRLFLPSLATVQRCQDKYALTTTLKGRGIPAPITYPVADESSLAEAWQSLAPADLAWCRIRRGFASRGATKVCSIEQAWSWISYWHTMRGVPVDEFTLCEFLPGRDYNVQGVWRDGQLVLIKMCERLSYLNADHQPSGMASTPGLAKTVWEPAAIHACERAIQVIDNQASGVFNFDLKENEAGIPCITEINAGRFAMITNIYDLTGTHNTAAWYVRLAFEDTETIDNPYDDVADYYLIRDLDTLPTILRADELLNRVERLL